MGYEIEGGCKPEIEVKYPHLLFDDSRVWTEFLRKWPDLFDRVWYDVHVGKGVVNPEPDREDMKRVVAAVTRKRIDVVGYRGGIYYVVELKLYGNSVALGQVVMYVDLFQQEYKAVRYVKGVIVCSVRDGDLDQVLKNERVDVFEVGRLFSENPL